VTTQISPGRTLIEDPYRLFSELRRETPVREGDVMVEFGAASFTSPDDKRPRFTLFRYEDIGRALRDSTAFSSRFWEEPGPREWTASLKMQGDEHRAWRMMLTQVFGPKAVQVWDESVIRPTAHRCAEELLAQGGRADLVEFALRFPLLMTYEIIGMSSSHPGEFERFQALAGDLLVTVLVDRDPDRMARNVVRAKTASDEIFAWLLETIARKHAEGAEGSDLISHMIRAQAASGARDDEQLARFGRSILQAATENTTRQFLNTATCLLLRPALLDAVRVDRTLVKPAIVEGERYESQSLTAPRVAVEEVELCGTVIPVGAFVLLAIGSGNRDPEAFPDPDTFDIGRSGRPSLTFGLGPHVCAGLSVARAEIGAALEALLDVLPGLRLDPDEEPPRIVGAPYRKPPSLLVVWS
jgi:cytochrome P450